ncbi:MAG: protein CapI [Pelagibacteraceae bacterium]|nr:protein CapI [Pelagibacteraceae bacterium]|tara:strand:+ start:9335 stop:10303 length:969 start_codon:yes stop_codon:yes gene_type:complete
MKILVTGCAGFIGYSCSNFFLSKNLRVYGIDNLNNYYDTKIKFDRLKILKKNQNFTFVKLDLNDSKKLNKFFSKSKFDYVINLAAQAGVRYSIQKPQAYVESNLLGFFNILDACVKYKIKHLLSASTSSVYGTSNKFPLKENTFTDNPISFYAATKKANEVMAHSYSSIHNLQITMLRFFTVYGPYGRPDMALFKFTESILNNKKVNLYNNGSHVRDFTYIDDVTQGVYNLIKIKNKNKIPYTVFNIANGKPITLMNFLKIIEKKLNKKARIRKLILQKGDIYKTHASIAKIKKNSKYKPKIDIEEGIDRFIKWYKSYFKIK